MKPLELTKKIKFAERMNHIPTSFIREILKVASKPDIISFAGGLPNTDSFPSEEIKESALSILSEEGSSVLQYTTTEGYFPLREFLAKRYTEQGIPTSPEEILITNGSQQGLDLCGKLFITKSDKIVLEAPSYLGAIQAFSAYQPELLTVPLEEDGINCARLEELLWENEVKLIYGIPNFQNPTGISYSEEKRRTVAELLHHNDALFIEDDPYGEIRFAGKHLPPIKYYNPQKTILLGSFSKTMAPGLRLGWIVASKEIIEKLVIAKQASDLHSNFLSQRIVHRFLTHYNWEGHIHRIASLYRTQKNRMVKMITNYFPEEIKFTHPEGGLFIWVTLPSYIDAMELLEEAMEYNIAFVPGETFYVNHSSKNTLRLNFSNATETEMEIGIQRLGKLIYKRMCNP